MTAQHVLNAQGATHDELQILLRRAPISILFDLCAVFWDEFNPDPDPDSDLVIVRIVKSQQAGLFAAGLASLDAALHVEIEKFGAVDCFYVFGFPDEGREYDYEKKELAAEMDCFRGHLTEPKVEGLSTIQIEGDRPDDLRGMSGSVVIADLDEVWKFTGMVTLASEKRGLLHFIPTEKIAYYLNSIVLMKKMGLMIPKDTDIPHLSGWNKPPLT
ncbi:hypothetical protein [Pseudomonas sp. JL3]|uniref:hypothetical protein n=1 Tax=Pseudomonas sp. JL3 TaxID=2919943 RepID=UPI002860651D|nr:hypothetical protein [Pseudomonas sp. JL3]MDR8365050.1 hypothetical protein [Pseudomonas sp. JL3]